MSVGSINSSVLFSLQGKREASTTAIARTGVIKPATTTDVQAAAVTKTLTTGKISTDTVSLSSTAQAALFKLVKTPAAPIKPVNVSDAQPTDTTATQSTKTGALNAPTGGSILPIKSGPVKLPVESTVGLAPPISLTPESAPTDEEATIQPIKVGPGQSPQDPVADQPIILVANPATPSATPNAQTSRTDYYASSIRAGGIEQPISLYPVNELA